MLSMSSLPAVIGDLLKFNLRKAHNSDLAMVLTHEQNKDLQLKDGDLVTFSLKTISNGHKLRPFAGSVTSPCSFAPNRDCWIKIDAELCRGYGLEGGLKVYARIKKIDVLSWFDSGEEVPLGDIRDDLETPAEEMDIAPAPECSSGPAEIPETSIKEKDVVPVPDPIAAAVVPAEPVTAPIIEEAPKKKRGRPRKVPIEETEDVPTNIPPEEPEGEVKTTSAQGKRQEISEDGRYIKYHVGSAVLRKKNPDYPWPAEEAAKEDGESA